VPSTSNAGPYSHLIITPDIKPPSPEPYDALAQQATARGQWLDDLHQQAVTANAMRENAADSPGFSVGHEKNQEWAANISRGASYFRGQAQLYTRMADVMRDVGSAHENIDRVAHNELAAAKTNLERGAIITTHHGDARIAAVNGVEMLGSYYTDFKSNYGSDAIALTGRLGNLPLDTPGPKPIPDDTGGIKKPVGETRKPGDPDQGQSDSQGQGQSDGNGASTTASPPAGGARGVTDGQAPSDTPAGEAGPSPLAMTTPAPRSVGVPSSGGGLSSGGLPTGGGVPGGMSGLGGGANPLSALTSGVGGLPGTTTPSGAGLPGAGGMPSVPGSGATVDPSAFARGVSAGSGVAGAVPPVSPPSSVLASPAAAGPVAGGTPSSMPAGLAASGAHTPLAPVAATATPPGAAPATGGMMLPPPGMGGPAAPAMAGGGAAATIPATAPTSSGGNSAGSGSAVNPNAGATLVPASVVTPAAGAAQRVRPLSPDVLAAAALAWSLARSGDVRAYPLDWAVGVFRSPSGSETVVMSGDGSGYVPVGVFLPRSARLMVSDPLVDSEFRRRWFGWADPARLLVEYAALRGHDEWKLVAAATTGPVDAFRSVSVEHTWVSRREEDRPAELAPDWAPPVLDELHVHRLQSEYADLYERLEKLSAVAPVFRERVIFPLTRALMEAALQVEGYPQELRVLWEAVKANREPGQAAWTTYNTACNQYFMQVGATRPGGFTDDLRPEQVSPQTHSYHRGQWTAARAMEHLGGWAAQPMPLPDMAYAAAAAYVGDIRQVLEPSLREVEQELN
jgi:hypothetical protein